MTQVTIAGATGLIGSRVCKILSDRPDVQGRALVRRAGVIGSSGRVVETIFSYDKPDAYRDIGSASWPCDVLFCCIGSTMAAAGSREAFVAIERDIPQQLIAALAKNNPRCRFVFVSSMGAGKPVGFYLENKAAVETVLKQSGLPYVILRPSLLMGGSRAQFRPGERVSQLLLPAVFKPFDLIGGRRLSWVGKYRPIDSNVVAQAAVRYGLDNGNENKQVVLEGWDLYV